jgi:hypothetical protein
VPTDLPPEFAPADATLSAADRSIIVVMTRVLGPQGLRIWADLLQNLPADAVAMEFDHLPADAGDATRQDIAERLVPYVRALHARHPELADAHADAPRGPLFAVQTADIAINDIYNPAQLDVLRRMTSLLRGPHRTDRT